MDDDGLIAAVAGGDDAKNPHLSRDPVVNAPVMTEIFRPKP
jgi:hypothetical protein